MTAEAQIIKIFTLLVPYNKPVEEMVMALS